MRHLLLGMVAAFIWSWATPAHAARVKDLVDVEGVRSNTLSGMGLVVGLAGTGDDQAVIATRRALANVISNHGIRLDAAEIQSKNVAVVFVQAQLPAFARPGGRIDIHVASAGSAKSLLGGNLLITPLTGPNQKVYALASGPMTVGGFSAGKSGSSKAKNHVTAGRIPGGAVVEVAAPSIDLARAEHLRLNLREPDFTTVTRMRDAIAQHLKPRVPEGLDLVRALSGRTLLLQVPPDYSGGAIGLLADVEPINLVPDEPARVVINERSGTVIANQAVRISPVAVAHGNLTVRIETSFQVSQPGPFGSGDTVVVPQSDISAEEEVAGGVAMKVLPAAVTVQEIVQGLNALGATPRDLVSIFQALRTAGALHAELVVQ